MAAHQTATLGRGVPPARPAQGGPSVAVPGGYRTERGAHHAAEVTGATYRQLDYWIRKGLLGTELQAIGTGGRRRFTDADLEVACALQRLAALGCRDQWLLAAGEAVRWGRVRPGEWLTLTLDCDVQRSATRAMFDQPDGPTWLIPLTPFDEGRPR